MTQENITKKTEPKYSEMLIKMVQEFDKKLSNKLTFEGTLEIVIEAWNLANNKGFLESRNLYEKELKGFENHLIIDEIVNYKIDNFSGFNNIIVDYNTVDNILQVKTQTQKNRFDSMMESMINYNPQK